MPSNKELRQAKRRDDWEKTKYLIEKGTQIVLSPPGLLVGGFVLTNYLQHAKMMDVDTNNVVVSSEAPWWKLAGSFINPLFMLIPDQKTITNYPSGTRPMTYLTEDQANVLRAGLVTQAAATSGLLGGILDTLTGLVKK